MSISLDMIYFAFKLLSLGLPLFFLPFTSELFEFNKIILLYLSVLLILFNWWAIIVSKKKLLFRKTIIDKPLIFFIIAVALSTFFSIDIRTSVLGYYSRWNGGLLSILSFSVLYWSFVTFIDKTKAIHLIKLLLLSTFIASMYASLEHFGFSTSCLLITKQFNVECWIQDVQNRVFGTFGQPNWLAAWLVGVSSLPLYFIIRSKRVLVKLAYILLFLLITITLHYTKSRSGILGILTSQTAFWLSALIIKKFNIKMFLLSTFCILLATVFIQTPWQIKLFSQTNQQTTTSTTGTVLESGGTDSGVIRKIVWKGSWDLFLKYPLFGSGLETFAYSYYQTRPVEHNLTSEWNFLYNKAHNEYLNYLSTTGTLGLLAYLILIASSFYVFFKGRKDILNLALFSGFVGILVSNFFGFSTVPVNFLFFIFPAVVLSSSKNKDYKINLQAFDTKQKVYFFLVILFFMYLLSMLVKYFVADIYYAKAQKSFNSSNINQAIQEITVSSNLFNNEPIYKAELASYYAYLPELSKESYALLSEVETTSKYNVKLLKQTANVYSDLAKNDNSFLEKERAVIDRLLVLAPTDASIRYMSSISHAKLGQLEDAISDLQKTIEMKPNYKLARRFLAYLYEDIGKADEARVQYKYILENIDPNDEIIKKDLENLK